MKYKKKGEWVRVKDWDDTEEEARSRRMRNETDKKKTMRRRRRIRRRREKQVTESRAELMTRPGWAEVPFLFSFSRHFLPVSLSVQVALSFSFSLPYGEWREGEKKEEADHCARFVRNVCVTDHSVSWWPVVLILSLFFLTRNVYISSSLALDYSQYACDAILLTYRPNVLSWLTSIKLPDSVMSNCCGACWPNDSQRLRESPWFTKAWWEGRKCGYKLNESIRNETCVKSTECNKLTIRRCIQQQLIYFIGCDTWTSMKRNRAHARVHK